MDYIDNMPTDGRGHAWNGKELEPFSLRRQVLFYAIKQSLPKQEIRGMGDFLGEASILLYLCAHGKKECDALCRDPNPHTTIFDWADDNIGNRKKMMAIQVALAIWDESSKEAVVTKADDDLPLEPEETATFQDGIAVS